MINYTVFENLKAIHRNIQETILSDIKNQDNKDKNVSELKEKNYYRDFSQVKTRSRVRPRIEVILW